MRVWVGRIGTIVAVLFLMAVVARGAPDLPSVDFKSPMVWFGLLGCVISYVAAQLIGARAWKSLLCAHGIRLGAGLAESQLLVSQIGKYVPGNVAHFLGRFVLAEQDGVSIKTCGAATLLEVALVLSTGVLVVAAMFLVDPAFFTQITGGVDWGSVSGITLAVIGLIITCGVVGSSVLYRFSGKTGISTRSLARVSALYILNFATLGLSLWFVGSVIGGDTIPLTQTIAVFSVAWVLGFIMPGAPGGIGVRDGVIALGMELHLGPGAGLGIAVAHRVLSVVGDGLSFGLGLMLRRRHERNAGQGV